MERMLKIRMKQRLLKYTTEVNDITRQLDFFTVMDKLKYNIISNLIFIKTEDEKTIIDIIYDEIIEDDIFVQEMTTSCNNILSNKLDNDEKLSCSKKDNININTKTSVSNNKTYARKCNA